MANYKVSYFPSKGNAEIMRLVLAIGEQKYEDERLNKDEWLKVKSASPTKQMPLLTVNGTVYGQSAACARYLARKFGLLGTTPEEELLIDEVYECIMDFLKEVSSILREQDETRVAGLKQKLFEEHSPKLNEYIKFRAGMFGKNGFIIGNKISLADLHIYNTVDQVGGRFPGIFSSAPELEKHAKVVQSDPRIQNWIKTMPQIPQ